MANTETWTLEVNDVPNMLVLLGYDSGRCPKFMKDEPTIDGKQYYPIGLVRSLSVKKMKDVTVLELSRFQFAHPGTGEVWGPRLVDMLMQATDVMVINMDMENSEKRFRILGEAGVEESSDGIVTTVTITIPVKPAMVELGFLSRLRQERAGSSGSGA